MSIKSTGVVAGLMLAVFWTAAGISNVAAVQADTAGAQDPIIGSWKLNHAESNFGAGPAAPKSKPRVTASRTLERSN
jgi:hypothetical protein